MEDALILLLQALFELIFEIILNAPIYFWPDTWGGAPWKKGPSLSAGNLSSGYLDGPIWNSFWLLLLGCAVGGVSVLVYGHALISVSFLRIANIIYSPVLSGFVAYAIAHLRHQDSQRRRFCYAFWFTFGVTIIRFTYANH